MKPKRIALLMHWASLLKNCVSTPEKLMRVVKTVGQRWGLTRLGCEQGLHSFNILSGGRSPNLFKKIYLVLTVLGLHYWVGFSLVRQGSRG